MPNTRLHHRPASERLRALRRMRSSLDRPVATRKGISQAGCRRSTVPWLRPVTLVQKRSLGKHRRSLLARLVRSGTSCVGKGRVNAPLMQRCKAFQDGWGLPLRPQLWSSRFTPPDRAPPDSSHSVERLSQSLGGHFRPHPAEQRSHDLKVQLECDCGLHFRND